MKRHSYIAIHSFFISTGKKLVLCILLLLCTHRLGAQTLNFRNLNTEQGLPTNNCFSAIQDRDGFIWVATNAGIAKFNGSRFTVYQMADGLTDNCIFALYQDDKDRIFYIPANARMGYIYNGKAYVPPFSDSLARCLGMGKSYIWKIGNYNDSLLLIATQRGFFTVDKATLSHLHLLPGTGMPGFYIKIINGVAYGAVYPELIPPMVQDNKGNCLCNIYIENGETMRSCSVWVTSGFGWSVLRPLYLHDGRLIVGLGANIITIFPDGRLINTPFPYVLNSVFADSHNGLWACSLMDGAYYYPNADLTCKPQKFLPDAVTRNFMEDRDGGLWCTTSRNGIYYNPNRELVNFSDHPEMIHSFYSLFPMGPYMVLGGMSSDLFLFSNRSTFRKITINTTVRGVHDAVRIGDQVYVSGYQGSFITDTCFRVKSSIHVPGKAGGMLYTVTQNIDGKLWAVRWDVLFRLNGDTLFDPVELPGRGSDIAHDREGNLYVATGKGVFIYRDAQFTQVPFVQVKTNNLENDPEGNVWACTDGYGVVCMRNGKAISWLSEKNGLSSGICYDIAFDGYNAIWIAGNNGLNRIGRGGVQHYTTYDGLPSNEVSHLAIQDDELYICSSKGLAVLNTTSIEHNHPVPSLFLRSVMINGKPASEGKIYSYYRNQVTIQLEGLSFKDPSGLRYRYRLRGLDKDWKQSAGDEIIYNSLPSGNYIFEAYVISADGISSDNVVRFVFAIREPFWRQSWFTILALGAAMFIIYLLVRWRIRKILAREAEKTHLYQLVADSQLKALQSQMNPHFIFNAVNSIQAYILNNDKISAYDYLTKFSLLIRKMLQQSRLKTISLHQELDTLRIYLELEQKRFRNKFTFRISVDENLPTEEVEIPTHIIQPFVENAIWHGLMPLQEREGELIISLLKQDDRILISIRDNGIGREASAEKKPHSGHESMGIAMVRERLVLLADKHYKRGEFFINDLRDARGNAGGTEVTIILYENHE